MNFLWAKQHLSHHRKFWFLCRCSFLPSLCVFSHFDLFLHFWYGTHATVLSAINIYWDCFKHISPAFSANSSIVFFFFSFHFVIHCLSSFTTVADWFTSPWKKLTAIGVVTPNTELEYIFSKEKEKNKTTRQQIHFAPYF